MTGETLSTPEGFAGLDIPESWRLAADRVAAHGHGRVVVLGAADTGKTTFCRFLRHRLADHGLPSAYLDTDLGQTSVGPPGTVALSHDLGRIDGAYAADAAYFVGAFSPAGHLAEAMTGAARVLVHASAPVTVINTCGFLHGEGLRLKALQLDLFQPSIVVALQREAELEALIRSQRHRRWLRLRPSAHAVPKPRGLRAAHRERVLAAHLVQGREHVFPVDRLIFQRTRLFSGRPYPHPRHHYAERSPEGHVLVTADAKPARRPDVSRLPVGFERGRLCGVCDGTETLLGLAVIREIDYATRRIRLWTPVPYRRVRLLQMGSVCLPETWEPVAAKRHLV